MCKIREVSKMNTKVNFNKHQRLIPKLSLNLGSMEGINNY